MLDISVAEDQSVGFKWSVHKELRLDDYRIGYPYVLVAYSENLLV